MGQIYNIPFGANFCDVLAEKLLEATKDSVYSLSDYTIVLPTSRAKRNLQKSFSEKSKNKNIILPKIISLGTFDEEEIELLGGDNILQTLPDIQRAFILSRFVMEIKPFDLNKAQAMKLAFELGNLFDKIETQKLDISNLAEIVPEDFAEHWQITLEFLNIISSRWEEHLKEKNLMSKARQRNLILESQKEIWKDSKQHIIIAGFSSTIPTMLDLMKVVYQNKNGTIVLQGLDRSLSFEKLSEINYLYGTFEILNHLKVDKNDVGDWIDVEEKRQKLTALFMLPADETSKWRTCNNSIDGLALENLEYVECENEQEEAETISVIIRKELDKPKQTVSLITPDRNIARRVASHLERWNIIANDSSGQPLQNTQIGVWLKTVINMIIEDFYPISLLSCLKHPLCNLDISITEIEDKIRTDKVVDIPDEIKNNLDVLNDKEEHSFPEFLKAHITLCEKLSKDQMWQVDFSEETANFVYDLHENNTEDKMTLEEYFSIFCLLLQSQQVRKKYGFHPRLSILGLTESRLTKSDVVILSGLNEDIWPPAPDIDGWMSRPMKKDFGMVSPDLNIGLSGFDFSNSFNCDKVYLTRAKKQNNSITIKSRWLNRLEGALESKDLSKQDWKSLVELLDKPDKMEEYKKPLPCPKLEHRPKRLSVSDIDVLRKNPYAIYAKKILKLEKIDDLEEEISVATKGTIIHACLEEFIKQYPVSMPNNASEILINIGKNVFAKELKNQDYLAFWWPRFENIVDWFISKETARRLNGYENILVEEQGMMNILGVDITAKADRMDISSEGIEIIDYKTGTPPNKKHIENLSYTQLAIEALIANEGGFKKDKIKNNVSKISIWSLKGKADEDNQIVYADVDSKILDNTKTLLENLITHFNDPRTTYPVEPDSQREHQYNDYAHLARMKMWKDQDDE